MSAVVVRYGNNDLRLKVLVKFLYLYILICIGYYNVSIITIQMLWWLFLVKLKNIFKKIMDQRLIKFIKTCFQKTLMLKMINNIENKIETNNSARWQESFLAPPPPLLNICIPIRCLHKIRGDPKNDAFYDYRIVLEKD